MVVCLEATLYQICWKELKMFIMETRTKRIRHGPACFYFIFYFYLFFTALLFFKFIYLFIYLWLHWVFIAVHGLSLVVASGGYSSLQCAGFSLDPPGPRLSSCGLRALEHRLSSCGAQA